MAVRAILVGTFVALVAANVWPFLLLNLGVPLAAIVETMFLALYVWWAGGGGPPLGTQGARRIAFRVGALSPAQWTWGVIAALSFAASVHAAIVLLFRLVPFPIVAFRQGYDFSFIPSRRLAWIAVVVSATSAGICEETGFRGYMQRPIEQRHGAPTPCRVLAAFHARASHQGWALIGMVPSCLALVCCPGYWRSSSSLIPGMIGHTVWTSASSATGGLESRETLRLGRFRNRS